MSTDSKTTNSATPVNLWILFHASGWAFNRYCHFCSPSHLGRSCDHSYTTVEEAGTLATAHLSRINQLIEELAKIHSDLSGLKPDCIPVKLLCPVGLSSLPEPSHHGGSHPAKLTFYPRPPDSFLASFPAWS